MKFVKKIVVFLLVFNLCAGCFGNIASAGSYNLYEYKKGTKLYSAKSIIKGKKHLTKYTSNGTQYQIVKIAKGKAILRPQKGWYDSEDPYFKNKKITYKFSSKCKFYYRNVMFPFKNKTVYYKRVPQSYAMKMIKKSKIYYERIEEVKKKYYTCGYGGEIYVKNGKIVAVLTDSGD